VFQVLAAAEDPGQGILVIKIGLVEDNEDFRAEVAFHLQHAGHDIVLQSDGRDIDALLRQTPCDLLLLDLGLPAEDGLTIARRLRQHHPQLGIVILTARNHLHDRLHGLTQGADAYLSKPVDMRELIAVIASLERRLAVTPAQTAAPTHWHLNATLLTLMSPQGDSVSLTFNELELLKVLGQASSTPVSRQELAAALGHLNPDFDERRLEVAFSRLRQKIEAVAPEANVIRAARGQGYLFAAPMTLIAEAPAAAGS
jgi:DNA-binding response OmpR family regulator